METAKGIDAEVCYCRPQKEREEIYWQDLTSDSADTNKQLSGRPVPDICPTCHKPIEKQITVIQICDQEKPTQHRSLMEAQS
jgi:hypothetical protein